MLQLFNKFNGFKTMLDIIKVCLQQVQQTKSKVLASLVAYTEGACTKCQTN